MNNWLIMTEKISLIYLEKISPLNLYKYCTIQWNYIISSSHLILSTTPPTSIDSMAYPVCSLLPRSSCRQASCSCSNMDSVDRPLSETRSKLVSVPHPTLRTLAWWVYLRHGWSSRYEYDFWENNLIFSSNMF